jgi:TolB-like protein/tetratricopeptide (TPR) repeat protein
MSGQMPDGAPPRELNAGDHIGRYRIIRPLGRGGMGVVYVARDDRLDRDVALKMIAGLADETARTRFWREARAAASVGHPNVCQVFEVDESSDGIFLTMELLEGEPLDRRLMRGALAPKDAVPITLGMLSALEALHARGLVHRDIKPSNVFLTHHGPKVLDFGLARPVLQGVAVADGATPVTQAGMIIGTPQYMAPEQVTGATVDARTDLYSVGAVIFQMLAGRPPFTGTGGDVLFAALKENPPALQGPPDVVAMDRVIRRAMRKDPLERYSCAADMSADLSSIPLSGVHAGPAMPTRALTRLVVAPLRIAKTDPDVSYLSFGLAEAVSGSLAGLGNIVVRAPSVAAKWNEDSPDLRQLAAAADVDLVMSSTLLRSGPQLRITTQLIEATTGTLVGSTSVKGSMDDVFALEDALTNAVVSLLTPQLTTGQKQGGPSPLRRDVPANPRAFDLFLRGMEEARTLSGTAKARELFQQAVDDDRDFAPAWAALGRCHRVWGKFYDDRDNSNRLAEQAFQRALELSPNLPLAHRFLTHFESEGGHAPNAIVRLLKHAATNRQDAQLFAGLVHACRYAGLFDASVAAHDEAMRLDPTVATGVEYTLAQMPGGAERVAQMTQRHRGNFDGVFPALAISTPSRAREVLATVDVTRVPPAYQKSFAAISAFAGGDSHATIDAIDRAIAAHVDPEALFLFGLMLTRIGEHDRGLGTVAAAVRSGYSPTETLRTSEAFDRVRERPVFRTIEEDAAQRARAARQLFEAAGGPEMLGMPAATRLSN